MRFLFTQILGIVALILLCISYFVKSKPKFLTLQATADIFYAGAFFVVNAYVAGIITLISIFRCVYIYFAEKYNFKYIVPCLSIFVLLYIAVAIIWWQSPLDIVPIITATMFTFSFAIKNLQVMRYVLIVPNIAIVIYNILLTTYASAILDLIEIIVLLVAIIQFNKSKSNDIILN